MIELSIPAQSLKGQSQSQSTPYDTDQPRPAEFTRALTCLTKIGDEIDVSMAHEWGLKLSAVNSSRSAFGVFVFSEEFFSLFHLEGDDEVPRKQAVTFSVVGKVSEVPTRRRRCCTAMEMLLGRMVLS